MNSDGHKTVTTASPLPLLGPDDKESWNSADEEMDPTIVFDCLQNVGKLGRRSTIPDRLLKVKNSEF